MIRLKWLTWTGKRNKWNNSDYWITISVLEDNAFTHAIWYQTQLSIKLLTSYSKFYLTKCHKWLSRHLIMKLTAMSSALLVKTEKQCTQLYYVTILKFEELIIINAGSQYKIEKFNFIKLIFSIYRKRGDEFSWKLHWERYIHLYL